MVKNDRQLSSTRAKLVRLLARIDTATTVGEQVSLKSVAADLQQEIDDYEEVVEGRRQRFSFDSVDELPDLFVKARLSRGWTQRDLADRLEVSEQRVQRDEASDYERAGLHRLIDVLDALEYSISGTMAPTEEASTYVELTVGNTSVPDIYMTTIGDAAGFVTDLPMGSVEAGESRMVESVSNQIRVGS